MHLMMHLSTRNFARGIAASDCNKTRTTEADKIYRRTRTSDRRGVRNSMCITRMYQSNSIYQSTIVRRLDDDSRPSDLRLPPGFVDDLLKRLRRLSLIERVVFCCQLTGLE